MKITITLPDPLHKILKERANKNCWDLENEIIFILKQNVLSNEKANDNFMLFVDKILERTHRKRGKKNLIQKD